VEPAEIHKQTAEIAEAHKHEHFNRIVAITVAVLALFMVIGKVKEGNVSTGVVTAQMAHLQAWTQFGEKTTKARLLDLQIQNWQMMIDAPVLTLTAARLERLQQAVAGAQKEFDEAKSGMDYEQDRAKDALARRDTLQEQQLWLQFSEGLLTLAITLLAVSALLRSKPLYALGVVVSVTGIFFELGGFLSWSFGGGFLHFLS
jgi:hypothetical protein